LKISDIIVEQPSTWTGTFLTFDMDWCHDSVLDFTLDMIHDYKVESTWFVTHDTKLIQKLQVDPLVELGIHPNFSRAHVSDRELVTPQKVVEELQQIIPEASSFRAHSLISSSKLALMMFESGLTHDSGVFIPESSGAVIYPWRHPSGLIQVPFCWADDVATYFKCGEPAVAMRDNPKSMRVLDFHPIHVFLNTPTMALYEQTRQYHQDPKKLERYRFDGFGTADRLREVLAELAKAKEGESSQ
jgi:hypothetical protein